MQLLVGLVLLFLYEAYKSHYLASFTSGDLARQQPQDASPNAVRLVPESRNPEVQSLDLKPQTPNL
jgi:hypothetical protein